MLCISNYLKNQMTCKRTSVYKNSTAPTLGGALFVLVSIYTPRQKFSIFQLYITFVTNPAEKLQNIKQSYIIYESGKTTYHSMCLLTLLSQIVNLADVIVRKNSF